jgi:hypothetical protein
MKRPKWSRPYWLIDHSPLPRGWRLRALIAYIDASYARDIRRAEHGRAKKDALERIHDDWSVESAILNEEQDVRYTRALVRQANRLRVLLPDSQGAWEDTPFENRRVLTNSGVKSLREAIREELRWRHERRAHWFTIVTPLASLIVGGIGAATGLIAVLQKAHGG